MSRTWVAIDGGQSTVRARASWADADAEIGGFVHTVDGVSVVTGQVEELIRMLPPSGAPIGTLVVGHTGLPVDDATRARLVDELLAARLAETVVVAPDEVTAHAGAFTGRPGVVSAVGTGAVTLGVDGRGRGHRVDGWGYLFGDAGSAYGISRAAIDSGLRYRDGRGPETVLAELAAEEYGADLRDATWDLYADPQRVDRVARFAPKVVAAADHDSVAAEIIAAAGREIARSLTAALGALPDVDEVAVVGRLVAAGSALDRSLRRALAELAPHARLATAAGGPLDGAQWIARHGPQLYRNLVYQGKGKE